jgi:hypothetical protein
MRGSIRKRGSTYSYWLDIGSDPVTGKRRQRTKGGFRTKRECQAALNEAISALRSGTLVQPSRGTVASFLMEEWLPAVRMAGLRDSTWASYRMNVEKHLVPGVGAIELQRLSPAQLNTFYRVLLTTGRRNRAGGLAPKTVRSIHSILHRALRDAVRWGYVVRNVADAADPPKAKYCRMEVRAWWSCGAGLLVVVVESAKKPVEVGLGVAPVERGGGLLVAALEGQQASFDLVQVGEVVGR